MGHLYVARGGVIKPTARLQNSPVVNQLITYTIAGCMIGLGCLIWVLTDQPLWVLAGFAAMIAAIFVTPAFLLWQASLVEFSANGIWLSKKNETIDIQSIKYIFILLGPKPSFPRFGQENPGRFMPNAVRVSRYIKVNERATFHAVTIKRINKQFDTQHFALNHPKDYESLLQIMKQWHAAGVEVSIRRKTES